MRTYLEQSIQPSRLQDHRDDCVGRAGVLQSLSLYPELEKGLAVAEIGDNHRNLSIGIEKCRGDEVIAVGSAGDPLCARSDESGKMPEHIMRRVEAQFPGLSICVDDAAPVSAARVSWSPALIEQQVPNCPADAPVI